MTLTGRKTQTVDWARARERLALAAQLLADQSSDPRRIEAVYRNRAAVLAAPPDRSDRGMERRRVVLFRLGSDCVAAPLSWVERIIPDPACTSLPGVAERWAGVIVADGEIVPVLDLARLLGLAPPEPSAPRNVIKLRQAKPDCGLLVGEVLEIRGFAPAELRPFTGNVALVEAVAPGNVLVLDIDSLIAQELRQ